MTAPALLRDRVVDGLSFLVVGEGSPVTVFAHGLAGSTAETRPLASKVAGTRVLFDHRGHGASAPLDDGWDYDLLARDLLTVADAVGATQAVGLSLGAGALLRLATHDSDRFTKLAFVLPAAIDAGRTDGAALRLQRLVDAIAGHDARAAADLMLEELPLAVRQRRGIDALLLRRARALVDRPAPAPRGRDHPVHDRALLSTVRVPSLVIGQHADDLHPWVLAAELNDALPSSDLLLLAEGGVFWTDAATAQQALADHLVED
ncbi:MAG: alpha/beta hydrolase fold protein [Frankiales bacterium]|nr:alpha/beta hydrolase fold protein [Frankiales bacterium]